MKSVFHKASSLLAGLSFCAKLGAFAGSVAGLLFASSYVAQSTTSWAQVLQVAVLLSIVVWLVVLLFVGVLLNYGVKRLAAPALVNSFITTVATVSVLYLIPPSGFALLIGYGMGMLVGAVLCWLCDWILRCM